jgi:hypothetical protein
MAGDSVSYEQKELSPSGQNIPRISPQATSRRSFAQFVSLFVARSAAWHAEEKNFHH